jgi:hypothetical protein
MAVGTALGGNTARQRISPWRVLCDDTILPMTDWTHYLPCSRSSWLMSGGGGARGSHFVSSQLQWSELKKGIPTRATIAMNDLLPWRRVPPPRVSNRYCMQSASHIDPLVETPTSLQPYGTIRVFMNSCQIDEFAILERSIGTCIGMLYEVGTHTAWRCINIRVGRTK